jgi:hypothetical protein
MILGAEGTPTTPEIEAKLNLMRIQQENASRFARSELKQKLELAAAVCTIVGTVFFLVTRKRR